MRKFIAWQNLERYRRLLANEATPERRVILERLLAEEEEIWAGLADEDNCTTGKPPERPKPS